MSVLGASLGILLYLRGYTYEGGMLAYMLPVWIIGRPYFAKRFTGFVPLFAVALLVPPLIYIQNAGVTARNWEYGGQHRFLLGIITPEGDGPLQWTRWLWLGTSMPAVEYLFYPAMSYFMLMSFALFTSALPDRANLERSPARGRCFYVAYAVFTAGFLALLLLREPSDVMDHNWYVMAVGITTGWLGLLVSRSFRELIRTRAMWWWLLFMGCGFQPLWEFFHSCLNHDWVYVTGRTMPAAYTFNGAPITLVEPFGYIAVTVTFPALIGALSDHLPKLAKRNGRPGYFEDGSEVAHEPGASAGALTAGRRARGQTA